VIYEISEELREAIKALPDTVIRPYPEYEMRRFDNVQLIYSEWVDRVRRFRENLQKDEVRWFQLSHDGHVIFFLDNSSESGCFTVVDVMYSTAAIAEEIHDIIKTS